MAKPATSTVAGLLPRGGKEGQYFRKASSTDYHGRWYSPIIERQLCSLDPAVPLVTGDGQAFFFVTPELAGKNLVGVFAALTGAQSSSGTVDIQIARVRGGVAADTLSTKLTVDANEDSSLTAAAPAVIDPANDDMQAGDLLRVDIDAVGTGSQGLIVTVQFQAP
jgi:hypothetical protein